MTTRRFLSFFGLLALALATFFCYPLSANDTIKRFISPSQWPDAPGLSPQLEGWPNAVRIYGENRYQTSLAAALSLRGEGGFPFDTPDPSSNGAGDLSSAAAWWGLGTCPRAVIIVAGDVAVDALAASSLSDPTGLSSEPYLRRTSSADPLFDPIGGFKRVDTDFAPVLVTKSARQGATTLSTPTRIAIQDLRSGGCRDARRAIIVGGFAAVSEEVEVELLSIGILEVFRISGENRFETAAAVATALGTAKTPSTQYRCADRFAGDQSSRMTFYANSVVEWRPAANQCSLLSRTVVLTDGLTGADALAAGWWTSFWQVPVLLHDGSNRLADATVSALQTLEIDNVIVLGGPKRISDGVLNEAAVLTGAVMRRVSGSDRYATSVAMAQQFGGWWPSFSPTAYSSAMLCVAGSSGSGARSVGWPDALGSGPWCGRASGAAANFGAPARLLEPLGGSFSTVATIPARPNRDATPVILVPAGNTKLPTSVANFLEELFVPADLWCSGRSAPVDCATPGFAVVFGGSSIIPDQVVAKISQLVSGGTSRSSVPVNPSLGGIFATRISMSEIYHEVGKGETRICLPRNSYAGARWISIGFNNNVRPESIIDVSVNGWLRSDHDGIARSSNGVGTPACIRIDASEATSLWVRATSSSGRVSETKTIPIGVASELNVVSAFSANNPMFSSGESSTSDAPTGGATERSYIIDPAETGLILNGQVATVFISSISITIERGIDGINPAPNVFAGQWSMSTTRGTLLGAVRGEAMFRDSKWYLEGTSDLTDGSWHESNGKGGFRAEITVNSSSPDDDAILWQIDQAAFGPN